MNKIHVAALLISCAGLASTAQASGSITTTLLPFKTDPSRDLVISATEKHVSSNTACLHFDLGPVARSHPTKITGATLRVIGTSDVQNTQVVRVFETNEQCTGPKTDRSSVASWTIRASGEEARTSGDGLVDVVAEALKERTNTLSLFLRSESRNSNWSYGSITLVGEDSDKKPRLIVTFEVDGDTSIASGDTTDWIFYSAGKPPVVDRTQIFTGLLADSEPLIHGDDVIVIAGGNVERLSTNGARRWPGVTISNPGMRSAIDRQGRLYNVGSDRQIRLFDLERNGEKIGEMPLDFLPNDTKLDKDLTVATGGNIYFATSGTHSYIYGLTPWTGKAAPKQLLPIWRTKTTTGGVATNVVVSPPGADFMTYTLAKEGFFALDAATGTKSDNTSEWKADRNWPRLNPVVSAGPEHEYAILAAGNSNGIVRAFSHGAWYWTQHLAVSQPTIDAKTNPSDPSIVAIAGGRFVRLDLLNGNERCHSDAGLAATSNIILDGESNAYFWNNGTFYIYGPDCKLIKEEPLGDLGENLTLRFAADGSVITRHGTTLYALQRRVADQTLTIDNDQIKDGYAYVGNAVRVSANTTLTAGTKTLLRGKQSVGFGNGFQVESGAELLVQVQ